MKSNNTIVIQGWMCNELELKGNELLIYALIYGFSQDGQSKFYGSRNYIADTFNISLPTVDKAIEGLRTKNLIIRYIITDTYGVHYEYGVCKETLQGVIKKLYGGSKETLHNNIDNNKTNINNISKDILLQPNMYNDISDKLYGNDKPKKKKSLYEKCLDVIYDNTDDLQLEDLLVTYLKMRLEVKEKPLYFNMWKGMISKLFSMSDKLSVLCDIVQQSIDKGWLAFYEVKSYGKKKDLQIVSSEFGAVTCKKADDEEMTDVYF